MSDILKYTKISRGAIIAAAFIAFSATAGAQTTDLNSALANTVTIIRSISMVICFAGLIFTAISAMTGRGDLIKWGIIGTVIGGLAWLIVKAFFSIGGSSVTISCMF